MKSIKLLIIILVIFAALLCGTIILLNIINKSEHTNTTPIINSNSNNTIGNNNVLNENIDAEAPKLTFNTSLQEIKSNSMLYSISNNINKYFNYIKQGNSQAVNELGGNNVYTISNNVKYVVKQAYSTSNEFMSKYYTYGILTVANGDFTANGQEIYMVVYLTSDNKGYKLQTITKEEFDNKSELQLEDKISITKGTYNIYEYEYVDNLKQMEIYLEDYIFQAFNNTQKSYELLHPEYREKRFGNINEYVEYLNEKQNQLRNIKIIQYTVDDGTVYKGTDEKGNYYHIIEKAYMEYEIILDNYTMQDYSYSNEKEKIEKSAEKFILMINSADYGNAYNLLEPTFKENNFPTKQDFINYVKSNFFERNIIASKEVSEDGICNVTIKETIATTSNKIQKQFKVTMGEGMEFTIEFNI